MKKINAWLYGILFLSGVVGLGYEIVWMKMLSYGLGHEGPAVLATLAAFFTGLALGAWCLDGLIAKSRAPHRVYAVLEVIIGLWALALIFLIPWANQWVGTLSGGTSPGRYLCGQYLGSCRRDLDHDFSIGTGLGLFQFDSTTGRFEFCLCPCCRDSKV